MDDGKILALDIATELGWAVGRPTDERPQWGTHKIRDKHSDVSAGLEFEKWLWSMIHGYHPDVVLIETPPSIRWAGKKTNAVTLNRLNHLARKAEEVAQMAIDNDQNGIPCFTVDAAQWKKALCGTARVSKSMRPYPPIECLAQLGWDVPNHNAADAVGIWLFGVGWRHPDAAVKFHPLARRALIKESRSESTQGQTRTRPPDMGRRAGVRVGLPQADADPTPGRATPGTFPYVFRWDRCGRKGQRCKVRARGTLNTAEVEFADGFVMVTSRNALMKAKDGQA